MERANALPRRRHQLVTRGRLVYRVIFLRRQSTPRGRHGNAKGVATRLHRSLFSVRIIVFFLLLFSFFFWRRDAVFMENQNAMEAWAWLALQVDGRWRVFFFFPTTDQRPEEVFSLKRSAKKGPPHTHTHTLTQK